ncbi:MAG: hypothetical protein ACP5JC_00570 [Candidatus Micrarchaeia archaeon]
MGEIETNRRGAGDEKYVKLPLAKGFAPAAIVFIFLIIASILLALLLVHERVDELSAGNIELKGVYEFQNKSYGIGKAGILIYCNYYRNPVSFLNSELPVEEINGNSLRVDGVWVKNRIYNISEKINYVFSGMGEWNTSNVQSKVSWLNTNGEVCSLSTYSGSLNGCSGSVVFNITCIGNDVETFEGIKKMNVSYYGVVEN